MMARKFRKLPVVIEAMQNTFGGERAIVDWSDGKVKIDPVSLDMLIITWEGTMRASKGDWIIKGVKGEFYPCKPDIFADTYEEVSDS
jgi:hypothetical protein